MSLEKINNLLLENQELTDKISKLKKEKDILLSSIKEEIKNYILNNNLIQNNIWKISSNGGSISCNNINSDLILFLKEYSSLIESIDLDENSWISIYADYVEIISNSFDELYQNIILKYSLKIDGTILLNREKSYLRQLQDISSKCHMLGLK